MRLRNRNTITLSKKQYIIGLMKDELVGKIKKKFVALRLQIYNYLWNDGQVDKRTKVTSKCVIKWEIEFEYWKSCYRNNKTILRWKHSFRSQAHIFFTENVYKIPLSQNDESRIQTPDGVTKNSICYTLEKYVEKNWQDNQKFTVEKTKEHSLNWKNIQDINSMRGWIRQSCRLFLWIHHVLYFCFTNLEV